MTDLLFIIGMQKSGTSLLNRMLMEQASINNPFLPEGKFFWGDNPPFTPIDKPCGRLYQKHKGLHGHFLDDSDYKLEDKLLLIERIKVADISEPILMNKNPYNSVRINWLKKIFPDCKIVAMYRHPLSNVFSLLKKYIKHNEQGIGPENGWWGIKPKNWSSIKSNDKVLQCSHQWSSVNNEIIKNSDNVDLMIDYVDLCNNPNKIINQILKIFDVTKESFDLPKCRNLNNEYLCGSRIVSKNQEFRKTSGFDLSNINEKIEISPLTVQQINTIKRLCFDIWNKLKANNLVE